MPKGFKHSLETRLKISLAKKGKPSGREGKKHSKETRLKMSLAKKGKPAHNKGQKMKEESKRKMSLSHLGKHISPTTEFKKGLKPWNKGIKTGMNPLLSNENHYMWKGDNVGYTALHQWLYKQSGKPNKCEYCGTITAKAYEWANKSRKYKRDVKDWIRLCAKCHRKYDLDYRKSLQF